MKTIGWLKDKEGIQALAAGVEAVATSPLLCEHLKMYKDWYGGDDPGFLWSTYAKADCEPLLKELEKWRTKTKSRG
jgi:hypothetical protein